jgi:6-pyruvoyltetrahydropterin/6-carboxytetrahydropterin synthase
MSNPLITKVYHFCAAHKYGHEDWSDEKNFEIFGPDAKVHGHNYELHVTVTGDINPDTGFVVDLGELGEIVNKYVLSHLDHSQFDKDIEWFDDKQPSSENLVIFIWNEISKHLKSAKLQRIRIVETPTIYTDYFG